MTTKQPDILLFLSDQHHADYLEWNPDVQVRTPNLRQLAEDGTRFQAAYSQCPLCVPSRMSFLTGNLPSETGIYTNSGAISPDHPTFVHALAAAGYETVLCGRMHFMGEDQRHGFTKRIMGEMTPLIWGRGGARRKDLGPYAGTMSLERCLSVIGGGTSPVLEYDRAVVRAALDYLQDEHEKPQFILVGTYGPHFSYVAPPELYEYYKSVVTLPPQYKENCNYKHPLIDRKKKHISEDHMKRVRSAYWGMIEHLDQQVGQVRETWRRFLEKRQRKGIFVYASDHGDQAGEHDLYGKQTFYEGSVRIPLIIEGTGIGAGQCMTNPVAMADIGPTLCELAFTEAVAGQYGHSLLKQLTGEGEEPDRIIISEYMDRDKERGWVPARMVRHGQWKLVSYAGYDSDDLLFNLDQDPHELHNCAKEKIEVYQELKNRLCRNWDVERLKQQASRKDEHHLLLQRWGIATDVPEPERWTVPEFARTLPSSMEY